MSSASSTRRLTPPLEGGGGEISNIETRQSLAGALALIVLALVGGGAAHAQSGSFNIQDFLFSQDFLVALLVGSTASPLADRSRIYPPRYRR